MVEFDIKKYHWSQEHKKKDGRGTMTEYLVALLPQHGVGQQVNGTRLSTRGRATRRGGCPVYTHATHCVPHEAVLTPNALNRTTKYPTGAWSI